MREEIIDFLSLSHTWTLWHVFCAGEIKLKRIGDSTPTAGPVGPGICGEALLVLI